MHFLLGELIQQHYLRGFDCTGWSLFSWHALFGFCLSL